jgi:methyltransferase-like protein
MSFYNSKVRYAQYSSVTNKELTLFSEPSIRKMSNQITYFLKGVSEKDIVVPDEFIIQVSDSFYENTPATLEQLQMMIVKYIVDYVKQEVYTIDKNNKLSIWVTKYDVESGLKQTSDVKLNNKRRAYYSYFSY